MDPSRLLLIALIVGLTVGAIAWFGPRLKQWRTHQDTSAGDTNPRRTGVEDDED